MNAQEILANLAASNNNVAAGVGECVSALVAVISAPLAGPILIEWADHIPIAIGRKKLSGMSGRQAFLYIKTKFGLLNATTPLKLQGVCVGSNRWAELDIDSWEEVAPYVQKIRVMT